MKTAAIYCRVSTPGQREEGTSLDTQLAACQEFAAGNFTVSPEHIYQEQASGGDLSRPKLSQVRQLVREHRVDAVIVYHPDRLSRDATDLMVLSDEIAQLGISLLFVNGPSGDSPEDKLLRFIFGYKSEAERRDITERTLRGKRQTARNGKLPVGTGRGLYGYQDKWEINEETGKPKRAGREIIEEEGAVVRQVFDLFIGGYSVYEIARQLNTKGIPTKGGAKWHPLNLKRMLANTAYMGVTYYGKERVEKVKNQTKRRRTAIATDDWIEVPGFTPAIVSDATFQRSQQRLAQPALRPGRAIEPYLLTGHIFCGYCNTPLVGTMLNKKFRYYRCRGAWRTATAERYCGARYIQRDKLNDAVWNTVKEVLERPDTVLAELRRLRAAEPSTLLEEIERLRREIRRCKDQELRLVKLYQYGEIDDDWIKTQSGPLKAARDGFEIELDRLEAQRAANADFSDIERQIVTYCERARHNLDNFSFEEMRMALKTLQVRAVVTETDVQVKGVVGGNSPASDILTTAQTSA